MSQFDQLCQNCRFFNREYVTENQADCRRYPPQERIDNENEIEELWYFPKVYEGSCCGEWRPVLESEHISAYDEEFDKD